jgi:hypothetical protein
VVGCSTIAWSNASIFLTEGNCIFVPVADKVDVMGELSWSCDFCGKGGLVISGAGIIYCQWCRMSYGKTMNDMLLESLVKKNGSKP